MSRREITSPGYIVPKLFSHKMLLLKGTLVIQMNKPEHLPPNRKSRNCIPNENSPWCSPILSCLVLSCSIPPSSPLPTLLLYQVIKICCSSRKGVLWAPLLIFLVFWCLAKVTILIEQHTGTQENVTKRYLEKRLSWLTKSSLSLQLYRIYMPRN